MTQSTESLYRQQAIKAHTSSQYGEVLLLPKANHLWIASFIGLWIFATGLFIANQPFAQTVEVKGWISSQTRSVHIRAKESAGVVERMYVKNGDFVNAGQPLLSLSRQSSSLLGSKRLQNNIQDLKQVFQLESDAINKQQIIIQTDINSLDQQEKHVRQQITLINKQLENISAQLSTLQQQQQSLQRLADDKLVATNQAQQVQLQWLDAENAAHALRFQSSQLSEQLLSINSQKLNKQRQISLLDNEKQQALLQHEHSLTTLVQSLNYTLFAPNDGVINNLHLAQGQSVELNQALLQVVPNQTKLKSLLSIPAQQAGFLLEKQTVKVKIDGFPYQKYGAIDGTISHISKQVLLPSDTAQMPIRQNTAVFMVEVELAKNKLEAKGEEWQIVSGMTVNASIQLDRPSILEWLIEPIYLALGQ